MLELIIGLAAISFIYAYLYSKTPENNQAFKLLFLALSLFSIVLLVWLMYNVPTEKVVYKYDSSGNFTGKEVMKISLDEGVKNTLLTYLEVSMYVPIIVIALVIIFWIWNAFGSLLRR